MTYLSIWEKICKYFERDCEETSRAAWENLTLSFRGKLSSYEWRAYAAKFLTLMRRTPGATEGEGLRLLRKQLPSFFGKKLKVRGLDAVAPAAVFSWVDWISILQNLPLLRGCSL